MPVVYHGTSSEAAPLLVALGWPSLVVSCREDAEVAARRAAVRDGGVPVLLALEASLELVPTLSAVVDADPLALQVEAVLDPLDTAEARLGFAETAGIGDAVNGLLTVLDETHKTLRNALDVGAGGNAELPSATNLKRALRQMRGRDPDDDSPEERESDVDLEKARRKALRGLNNHVKKTTSVVKKHIDKLSKKHKMKGAKKGVVKPSAKKRTRPKKSDWAPRQKRVSDDHGTLGPTFSAPADVTVKGKLGGKPHTVNIKRGQQIKAGKGLGGFHLWTPGMRGTMIVNPSDRGKLVGR